MKTVIFKDLYLNDYYLIIGKDEAKQIKKYDEIIKDYYYGEKSFEQAEIKMQENAIKKLINKNNLSDRDIDILIGADLNSQITASSYSAVSFNIPFLGVYAACSSFTEELLLTGLLNNSGIKRFVTCVSSHSLCAERQFRYPVEYGHSRPFTSTVTATGAVSVLVSNSPSRVKIKCGTIGKVIDMGINDVNNMGAVMTPACANTLYHHIHNLHKKISDYDLILTGDLGKVGVSLLKDYYYKTFNEKLEHIVDCGNQLYINDNSKYSGGSGPCCLPMILFGNIINQKKYHKILILGTGALHNSILVNQKRTIPAVCHAIELEVL